MQMNKLGVFIQGNMDRTDGGNQVASINPAHRTWATLGTYTATASGDRCGGGRSGGGRR